MFRDIPEYREVPCIRECREDQALVGVVVEEGEHNMMADIGERRREHSLHHMDSLGREKKDAQIIGLLDDLLFTREKEIDWNQI